MEFGLCQPDPDFGRMCSGSASSPMVAAAQAGAALADELYSAAGGYQSVVSELASGDWFGPSRTPTLARRSARPPPTHSPPWPAHRDLSMRQDSAVIPGDVPYVMMGSMTFQHRKSVSDLLRVGIAGLDDRCGGAGEAIGLHLSVHRGRPVHVGERGEHVRRQEGETSVRLPPDCALGRQAGRLRRRPLRTTDRDDRCRGRGRDQQLVMCSHLRRAARRRPDERTGIR
ncbi:PPE domain-containing protein [Mycobacterium sp.]|uniref:PPE domain-containing protein n=1 Tax=Mycobacterium sp. TaxID=1785 RepID=UPI00342C99FE